MAALKTVLGKNYKLTVPYTDDIVINATKVSMEEAVKKKKFVLIAKPAKSVNREPVLGLGLNREKQGQLMFKKGNGVLEMKEDMSRARIVLNLWQAGGTLSHCWMAKNRMQLHKKSER